jgi:hypothetical protein
VSDLGRERALSRALGLRFVRLLDIQWNDETQLQGLSVPARDHPSGDLALFPVHIESFRDVEDLLAERRIRKSNLRLQAKSSKPCG